MEGWEGTEEERSQNWMSFFWRMEPPTAEATEHTERRTEIQVCLILVIRFLGRK